MKKLSMHCYLSKEIALWLMVRGKLCFIMNDHVLRHAVILEQIRSQIWLHNSKYYWNILQVFCTLVYILLMYFDPEYTSAITIHPLIDPTFFDQYAMMIIVLLLYFFSLSCLLLIFNIIVSPSNSMLTRTTIIDLSSLQFRSNGGCFRFCWWKRSKACFRHEES